MLHLKEFDIHMIYVALTTRLEYEPFQKQE